MYLSFKYYVKSYKARINPSIEKLVPSSSSKYDYLKYFSIWSKDFPKVSGNKKHANSAFKAQTTVNIINTPKAPKASTDDGYNFNVTNMKKYAIAIIRPLNFPLTLTGKSSPNKVHGITNNPIALKLTYDKIHIIKNGCCASDASVLYIFMYIAANKVLNPIPMLDTINKVRLPIRLEMAATITAITNLEIEKLEG